MSKDLSGRFGLGEDEERPQAKASTADPLARLNEPEPGEGEQRPSHLRRWFDTLRKRADLMAVAFALLAAALVAWPALHPRVVLLPKVTETNTEIATLTVQPLAEGSVTTTPDWDGLFNAYQLETALRDISIRCNYALPPDARVDRYLHARLMAGQQIRVFLADPGTCPRF